MIDLEFLVQYLVLQNVAQYPELVEYSDNIRQLEALSNTGVISADAAAQLTAVYIALREQVHRLSLQAKPSRLSEAVLEQERAMLVYYWQELLENN